jgi:hypothetical protein
MAIRDARIVEREREEGHELGRVHPVDPCLVDGRVVLFDACGDGDVEPAGALEDVGELRFGDLDRGVDAQAQLVADRARETLRPETARVLAQRCRARRSDRAHRAVDHQDARVAAGRGFRDQQRRDREDP